MLEEADLTGDKYIWLFSLRFLFIHYHCVLFVSTEMPQVPARFCASKNGLTTNVLITSLFYTYNDSLVK